jgi:hypothetical protein
LVFLIVLIVATAVLIAWLLVGLARAALGDFRVSRFRQGGFQSAPSTGPPLPAVDGKAPEGNGADSDRGRDRREPAEPPSRREQPREDLVLYDETDVERAVRDRLYGRHGRRD